MTDRFPLIINSEDQQIQELSSGDNLDLTGSGIVADVFTVDTNSEERLRIDSLGNVLIGDTTQATADIALNADGTATFAGDVTGGGYFYSTGDGSYLVIDRTNTTNAASALANFTSDRGSFSITADGGVTSTGNFNTDGSASFAGNVNSTGFDSSSDSGVGFKLFAAGQIESQRAKTGQPNQVQAVFRGYQGTDVTSVIDSDGSATFARAVNVNLAAGSTNGDFAVRSGTKKRVGIDAAGDIKLGDDIQSAQTILLRGSDGSAEFAGAVSIGDRNTSSASGSGHRLFTNSTYSALFTQASSSAADTTTVYRVHKGTDEKIDFKADGSATFAGLVYGSTFQNVGGYVGTDPTTNEFSIGSLTTIKSSNNRSATDSAFEVRYGTSKTVGFDCDGSATFAGDVVRGTYAANTNYCALRDGQLEIGRNTNNGNLTLIKGTRYNGATTYDTFNFKADGSATFGPVNISSSTGYGAQVDMAANAATVNAQCQQTASQYTLLFAGYQGANRNFHVTAAGAAEFAGTIQSTDYPTTGYQLESGGSLGLNAVAGTSGNMFALAVGGTQVASITGQGSATFKDYVNVQINSSNLAKLQFENSASRLQYSNATGHIELYTNNAVRNRFLYNGQGTAFSNQSIVYPTTDNAVDLGGAGNRWDDVYATNGTIQTSDSRLKHEVETSVLGTDFVKALRPVSYKWIGGENVPIVDGTEENGDNIYRTDGDGNWVYESRAGARKHWGFIAQEVKQAVDDAGVDFAGWTLADKDDPDSTQSLRYEEFIAPLTKALQEAITKIETLEAKVAALEAG